ncbi:hypothetical protein TNCV_4526901 [Trichonephila clavipes]|nr:hypothetical protein TNCV_4526901 [Trichonephila clavipes]
MLSKLVGWDMTSYHRDASLWDYQDSVDRVGTTATMAAVLKLWPTDPRVSLEPFQEPRSSDEEDASAGFPLPKRSYHTNVRTLSDGRFYVRHPLHGRSLV